MLSNHFTCAFDTGNSRFMSSTSFRSALMIIDMQNDFCPPHGSLKVDGATDALPVCVETFLSLIAKNHFLTIFDCHFR
jgi:hypothetical protein